MFWEDVTFGDYLNTMTCFLVSISYYFVAPLILWSKKMIKIVNVIIMVCVEN